MPPLDIKDGTIDAGLYLLDLVREPGRVYSQTEIAIACGCTGSNISYIERRAMEKIELEFRRRMQDMEPPPPVRDVPSSVIRKAAAMHRNSKWDGQQKKHEHGIRYAIFD